ncbi:EF-hand domain-containing protein [Methylobacterium nonmethylotrophicum]|uniref:EF-hand domain-containing protein n=1 Tax=Methylobacterium nonmethylotrophicum TaxID=1141884 RepID=A0A4Z0NWL7_9HYPH|nr:EF-hand domain-containing protein [Methylobacterium nonmethylotrophicum]TGE01714.1 EF-hand domain-containing protein [Methylobacterium nonmethylotrophicum]
MSPTPKSPTRTLLIAALAAAPLALPASAEAKPRGDRTIAAVDTDSDGTVDLAEAKAAAGAVFDRLEKDADGTLDTKELQGRVSRKDMKQADPDNDGTLTKDEYLALVEARFKLADPDNDGTLDAKEMRSPAGKALARLLK